MKRRPPRIGALEAAIRDFAFARLALPYEAGFLAGKAFVRYRDHGGTRHSPLPDFYIGAHAALAGLTSNGAASGLWT